MSGLNTRKGRAEAAFIRDENGEQVALHCVRTAGWVGFAQPGESQGASAEQTYRCDRRSLELVPG